MTKLLRYIEFTFKKKEHSNSVKYKSQQRGPVLFMCRSVSSTVVWGTTFLTEMRLEARPLPIKNIC